MARGKTLNIWSLYLSQYLAQKIALKMHQFFYLFLVLKGCIVISQAEEAEG